MSISSRFYNGNGAEQNHEQQEGAVQVQLQTYDATEKPFKCPNHGCDYMTRWAFVLRRHQRRCRAAHTDHKPFRCPIPFCKHRTKWSNNLRKHCRCIHRIELPSKKKLLQSKNIVRLPIECETETDKVDVNNSSLAIQSGSTDLSSCYPKSVANFKAPTPTIRPERCENSNLILDTATKDDNIHKRVPTNNEFHCDKCSYKGSCASNLKMHSRYHSSEKPFKCPNLGCDYKTRWDHTLRRHQQWCRGQVPTAVDKRRCEGSSELSKESGDLIEEGEPLNVCTICGFIAYGKESLQRHLSVHIDHKPFHCPNEGCTYQTKQPDSLRRHYVTCIHRIEFPPTPLQSEDNLGPITDSETETEFDVNNSCRSMAYACMLCDFVGVSELSAVEHARQHTAVNVPLDQIH